MLVLNVHGLCEARLGHKMHPCSAHRHTVLVTWTTLMALISTCIAVREEVVCPSTDIRNTADQLNKLKNCTVIEGNLKILLIDYGEWSHFEHKSFPNLVEITDYLLLYRVRGLKSLRNLFPNLTVIKGQTLFFNYGLVVFEMQQMVELGLPSLTTISRGAVRIEKNGQLCYINTIDWTQIAVSVSAEDNFIVQNKDIDECVDTCPSYCPTARIGDRSRHLCWTISDCQKAISSCGPGQSSWDGKLCCHESCIGGCTGPLPTECIACKNVFHNGRCQQRCDPGTYVYKQRRCISKSECIAMSLVLYDKQCVEECPGGYTTKRSSPYECVRCAGLCPKKCDSLNVDSVAAAQKLKGCTVIEGVLMIQIGGGIGVGKELEENLGQIEEIDHYLKITRSYALMSLSFLKNLKRINGRLLHNSRHSMVVLDNQNLQDIWDVSTHPKVNFTVNPEASVFFQGNRKLCLHKIQQLVEVSNLQKNVDDKDISYITNGDQVTCNNTEIKVGVAIGEKYVVLNWNNFNSSDPRELLNFVVNFREAPSRNITKFSARDACGNDVWKTEDARVPDIDTKQVYHILFNLKPYTQYALYVNTYMISSARLGGMSDIIYITTKAATPTNPRDLLVKADNEGELIVYWEPPSTPNGNITHYYVYWQEVALQPELFDQRNYCVDKLKLITRKNDDLDEREESNKNTTEINCASCSCGEEVVDKEKENERQYQIMFENFLHNSVYTKRPMPSRKRRSLMDKMVDQEDVAAVNTTETTETPSEESPQNTTYHAAIVNHKTFLVIPNLNHFTEYNIEVIACQDYDPVAKEKLCSNRAIITGRTKAKSKADDLDESTIQIVNRSQGIVALRWSDPVNPNGLVVTYEIEYKPVHISNVRPINRCISHKTFRQRGYRTKRSTGPFTGGYVVDKLGVGNYTFRIRATSLAGNGSWTSYKYFYVADTETRPNSAHMTLIAGITASAAFVVILIASGSVWYAAKRRYNPNIPEGVLYASVNPEYMCADAYIPDKWEVVRDKITIMNELGQGSFGMVYEGVARDLSPDQPEVRVAVKTVNENASIRDRIEFLHEASVMKSFNCNHVVKLLGVVSKGQPTLVIMELMANGDLKKFLRLHRPDEQEENAEPLPPPSLKKILQMAAEISDGMAYLAGQKYVHRDLAARNCMVSEDLTVKIGDFGMTRDIYETDYYRKGGKGLLPVRWMAPESLRDGVFTSMSDVWSFGVVLWEMATLAAQPYQGLANEQVLKYVIDGGLMDKPEGCPDRLYDLMKRCWRHNPKMRPTFCEIIEMLVPDLEPSFKDKSYFFSDENTYHSDQDEEKPDMDDSFTPLTQPEPPERRTDSESSLTKPRSRYTPAAGVSTDTLRSTDTMRSGELAPAGTLPADDVYGHRYPSVSSHNQNDADECIDILDSDVKVRRAPSSNSTNCHNNSGAAPCSPDGSKGSSKSSNSSNSSYSHVQINGIANGHLPVYSLRHQTTC